MVSLILKERDSKTKVRIFQTKTRPNHFLILLTKFPKILENISFAFITLHNRFPMMGFSSFLAVYFSIMNLEQSVKDLQAQNTEFQALILNLSKGQEELKAMLTKKKKKKGKKTQVKKLRPILQLRDAETAEDSDEDEQDDDASVKTDAKSNHDSAKHSDEEEDYYPEDEHPDDKYKS